MAETISGWREIRQHETRAISKSAACQRYAGIWSLWALGVGAVISGHFSGWNFGFMTGGWGGMLVAGAIICVMYLGLVFCIAEMSPALPHTGAAYSFARTAMGPWGGFVTGLFENVEYVHRPGGDLHLRRRDLLRRWPGMDVALLPNLVGGALRHLPRAQHLRRGAELQGDAGRHASVTARSSSSSGSSASRTSISRSWALNIGVGPDGKAVELPEGNGPLVPVRLLGRARHPALRGLAVPCHRAGTAGRRRIGRSQARPAARHHARAC